MLLDSVTFVQAVRQYRLLDTRQADEFARFAQGQPPDSHALAKDLLGRGLLTAFQVNQLLQGRGGSLLLGSYVLLERLGEGGMGAVYKARNWKIGRVVALKLIRKECLENESIVRRFHREIEAAAQLSHPNIIHAFDADEADGTHFFVMELVAGVDLSKLVKQHGPLPVRQACDYVRQAALGLQHAHERGMVHRDIKPSNLLLSDEGGVIKVLDMGLARLTGVTVEGELTSQLTQQGAVMGTPDYIAPEQTLDAHSADIRADLYSLGCTFYHLLAGRVPFPGGTLGQKIAKHLSREPEPLRGLRPDVPERVASIVARLMAKRPEQRYQTPGELALELTTLLAARQAPEPATSVSAATVALANPFEFSLPGDTRADSGPDRTPTATPAPIKRFALWGAGGALVFALLFTVVALRSRSKPDTQTASPGQTNPADMTGLPPKSGPSTELDPDSAASDSEEGVQGEYAGTIAGNKYAAQVMAAGANQFAIRLLAGGLPGDGWDGRTEIRCGGRLEKLGLSFWSEDSKWTGVIVERLLNGREADGTGFSLSRLRRKSPTLGSAPPGGAVVLFDGSGVEEWVGGQMADGLLKAGAVSKKQFAHSRLHLEYRLPLQSAARGQGRANSGVFLQNRYEIQILDSFGLPPSKVDCGAVYGQTAPAVNMCLPPLSWQTYDIEFQAARFTDAGKAANAVVTIRHNGVLIHDRTPITGPTHGGAPESEAPGPLQLQDHGNPVVFRNVWIVPLP